MNSIIKGSVAILLTAMTFVCQAKIEEFCDQVCREGNFNGVAFRMIAQNAIAQVDAELAQGAAIFSRLYSDFRRFKNKAGKYRWASSKAKRAEKRFKRAARMVAKNQQKLLLERTKLKQLAQRMQQVSNCDEALQYSMAAENAINGTLHVVSQMEKEAKTQVDFLQKKYGQVQPQRRYAESGRWMALLGHWMVRNAHAATKEDEQRLADEFDMLFLTILDIVLHQQVQDLNKPTLLPLLKQQLQATGGGR